MIPHIFIEDYTYSLPADKIAHFPLEDRKQAKLLVYKNDKITDHVFYELPRLLPPNTLLVCNNSKVIQARLLFPTTTTKSIEIFVMEILKQDAGKALIKGMIGNNAKWKTTTIPLEKNNLLLEAEKIEQSEDSLFIIQLQWNDKQKNIFEILSTFGHTPLPPYIKRSDIEDDKKNYQTIFAQKHGSVAAPTAGLHFTPDIIHSLQQKNTTLLELTLHVSGGTFLPVKTKYIEQHTMHAEQVIFTKNHIQKLISHIENKHPICAVGTTSLRSLESLHSLGLLLSENTCLNISNIEIPQWFSFESKLSLPYIESLKLILKTMNQHHKEEISFKTKICIVPTYKIQSVDYLITNFHQPHSTLLLLIAAFVGKDWKKIYDHALHNQYRFLSYGDTSLLQYKKEPSICQE